MKEKKKELSAYGKQMVDNLRKSLLKNEAFVQAILVTCVISSQCPEPYWPVLTVRVAESVRLAYQLRYEPTKSVRTL